MTFVPQIRPTADVYWKRRSRNSFAARLGYSKCLDNDNGSPDHDNGSSDHDNGSSDIAPDSLEDIGRRVNTNGI